MLGNLENMCYDSPQSTRIGGFPAIAGCIRAWVSLTYLVAIINDSTVEEEGIVMDEMVGS